MPVTQYNYYNSGSDGLKWDCINIIREAKCKKSIRLSDNSPYWRCLINGRMLCPGSINESYVTMIQKFLSPDHKPDDLQELIDLHKLVDGMDI